MIEYYINFQHKKAGSEYADDYIDEDRVILKVCLIYKIVSRLCLITDELKAKFYLENINGAWYQLHPQIINIFW